MVNEIIGAVGSVGFPILACIYMWKQNVKTMGFYQKTLTQQTQLIESIDKRLALLEDNLKEKGDITNGIN